jgi:hypothetical protein
VQQKGCSMSALLKGILIATALLGAPAGYVFYNAVISPDNWVYQGGSPANWKDAGYHGAPGPIAGAGLGAGLPFLAVGYGVYWLVRRSRRKPKLAQSRAAKALHSHSETNRQRLVLGI